MYVIPVVYEVISTQELLDKYYPFPDTTSSPEMVEDVVCKSIYDYGCSCMRYLRIIKGLSVGGYDAGDIQPNSFTPHKGDVALFKYTNIYHAAYIEETYFISFKVSEWNYVAGKYTERIIRNDDPALRGYLHKVQ